MIGRSVMPIQPLGGPIESSAPLAWVVEPAAASLPTLVQAPELSAACGALLEDISVLDENGARRSIQVPAERALRVVLDGHDLVTLMTLGAAPELLVLGYLRNQRLIAAATDLESIHVDWHSGVARVRSHAGRRVGHTAGGFAPTGCGLGTAFGTQASQADFSLPPAAVARIAQRTLLSVTELMKQRDAIHRAAGSVHSCALFCAEELWVSIEDVSRHNGLDTVSGWMALHGVPGADKLLFSTGRLTAEMVLKAAHIGVPILISRNGTTAAGVATARRLGMTLITRAQKGRFMIVCGEQRFDAQPSSG